MSQLKIHLSHYDVYDVDDMAQLMVNNGHIHEVDDEVSQTHSI